MNLLVAIEIKRSDWWRTAFGFDVSVLEVLGLSAGRHATGKWLVKMEGGGKLGSLHSGLGFDFVHWMISVIFGNWSCLQYMLLFGETMG